MVKNVGNKIKCGRLMKSIKSSNSGLIQISIFLTSQMANYWLFTCNTSIEEISRGPQRGYNLVRLACNLSNLDLVNTNP